MNNPLRVGNFTSSGIVALTSKGTRPMETLELIAHKKQFPKSQKKNIECWPGPGALTYIAERNMERRLGRSLTQPSNARPLVWGNLLERRAFKLLDTSYVLVSQETIQHSRLKSWTGSPDGFNSDKGKTAVIDIKCPITLKSFCQFVDAWKKGGISEIREAHEDGEKYYWQLVSNACLTKCKFAELIIYMPYKSELDAIRHMAEGVPDCYWIMSSQDDELPWLPDGGHYKNLNVMRFEIPVEDKKLLGHYVSEASKMLVEFSPIPIAA
jgi:hypothetical protein